MSKSGPAAANSGDTVTYTLTVTNSGQTASAAGVVVQDQLPVGMAATGATGATCVPLNSAGATLSCTLPSAVAANGGTAAITLTTTAPATGGAITNKASVDPTGGNNPPTASSCTPATAGCAEASTTITPKADLVISKSASPSGTYVPGQPLNYTITVTNNGPSAVSGASVSDSVPASVSINSSGISCVPTGAGASCGTNASAGNGVSYTGVNLPAGGAATISISGTAQLSATGDIVNTASVTSPMISSTCSTAPCTTSSTTTNTNSGAPKLSITKSATPLAFAVGQSGTYSIMVSNSGTSSTSGVITVTDPLPAGITATSAGGTGWSCNASASSLVCTTAAVLLPLANAPVLNIQVSVAANAASPVINTATVSGGGATCQTNCEGTITTNVDAPALEVKKTLSNPFVVNVANSYVITATNKGQAATLAGTITDDVPAAVTLGAMPNGCTASGQTVTCQVPAGIATGGAVSYTIPVTPQAAANGQSLSNTAVANPNTGDTSCPAAAHCSGTTDNPVLAPQLTLTKQASVGTFTVDVPAQYTLVLTNTGTADTTAAATVSDTIPAGLTIDTANLPAGCAQNPAGSQTLVCSVATLAKGASVTFSIGVTAQNAVNGQSVTNQATATGGGDPLCVAGAAAADLPARCKPSATTAVNAPQLTLAKAAGSFSVGVPSTYTLSVSNTGTAPTSGDITITDVVPSSLTLGTLPAGCSNVGQQVSCTITQNLAAGASAVNFVIPVTPQASASPSVSNSASVQGGGDPTCPTTANCQATTSTAVDAPSLALTKTDNGAWVVGQADAQYTLSVQNTHASVATVGTITVKDSMPAGITPAAGTYGNWACTASGQDMTCTSSTAIAAGASDSIVLPVTVTAAAISSGTSASVTNNASVAGGGDPYNGGTPPAPGSACTDAAHCTSKVTTVSTAASITTLKSLTQVNGAAVPPAYQVQPGDVLQYTITVSNAGGTAGSTTLTETVPTGTTYTGGAGEGWDTTPSACAAAGSTCTKTVSAPATGSSSATFTVTVASPLAQGAISNTVASSATGSCGGADCTVQTSSAEVDVRAVITKIPSAPLVIGTPITIEGVCTNFGPATAVNVSCNLTVDTVLKASLPATCDAPRTLLVNESLKCTVEDYTPTQAMGITARVIAATDSYETLYTNNQDVKAVDANTPSLLNVVKSLVNVNGAAVPVGYLVRPGDTLRYQLQVNNAGGTAGSTTLTETVPTGTSYVGTGENWTPACNASGSTCAQMLVVPALGSVNAYFTVKIDDALASASIVNTIASSEPGSCGSTCTATTLGSQADVSVMTPSSVSANVGDEVAVVSTCTNIGSADTINAYCEVSGAPSEAVTVCAPTSPVAALAVGASISCTTSFKSTAATSFVLVTTSRHGLFDPVPGNNSGSTTVIIGNAPVAAPTPVSMDARWALWLLSLLLMMFGAGVLRRK